MSFLTKPEAVRAILSHTMACAAANASQPKIKATDMATFEAKRKRVKDGLVSGVLSTTDARQYLANIDAEESAIRNTAKSQAKVKAGPEIESLIQLVVEGAYQFRDFTDPGLAVEGDPADVLGTLL